MSFYFGQVFSGTPGMYLYGCVSLLAPECVVCLYLCVRYQIKVSVKNHIMCQTSVKVIPYCVKHIKVLLVPRYQSSPCVDPYHH